MKKLTRKLLMSIIAVAFAFVALGTSTYAWFSMNQTVAVEGMQISAKSDSTYLIIGGTNVLADVQEANAISVPMNIANDVKIYPSAHETLNNATDAAVVENWYFETAATPDASTAKEGTKTVLTSANFEKYVIKKTVYVTLAKGSNQATNLKVNNFALEQRTDENLTGTSKTHSPVKVVIASPIAVAELDSTNTTSDAILAETVTDQALIALDIYIYYNGADTNVFTNNIANLAGAKITLSFSVDAVAQGN